MTATLNGPDVVLRPLAVADAEALHIAHGDPEIHHYWASPAHRTVDETARYIEQTLSIIGAEAWAITEDGGEALGRIALFQVRDGVGEIGIILRREAQGRGLALRAIQLVEAYAFEARGMHRVMADVDPDNSASATLFYRLGYEKEGVLKGNWKTHIGVRDSIIFGKLKPDPE